jgi:acyl dehydratase
VTREKLYFEDLHVGQRFITGSHRIDAEQIKAFARQFDPQPFHLDEEEAKHSFFGELVASGWHTAGITMKLIVTGGAPLAAGAIGGGGELRWPKPVKPGDVLHVESEIVAIRPSESKPDRGIVTFRQETKTEDGSIVQVFVVNVIVPRRTSPATS